MSLSHLEKNARLSSESQIGDLADADLSAIFERLPPFDRLIASEVCRRWHRLSRKEWLDVMHLDLTPIPEQHCVAVLRLCPNLQSVFARDKSFNMRVLACLSRSSELSTVKLYGCNFAGSDPPEAGFPTTVSDSLEHASWNELIFHGAFMAPEWRFSGAYLPASLTRLQLSCLRIRKRATEWAVVMLNALDRLQNLECLILHHAPDSAFIADDLACCSFLYRNYSKIRKKIGAMKNLKELCIGPMQAVIFCDLRVIISSLPKLEVLFLSHLNGDSCKYGLEDAIRGHSRLRILVFSGKVHRHTWQENWHTYPVDLPSRRCFRYAVGAEPTPLRLLHIFVCKEAAVNFCFDTSCSTQVIYPINEPMPQFLERDDIAPIFDGVWVAKKIKEAAKNGGKLWNYEAEDTASSVIDDSARWEHPQR